MWTDGRYFLQARQQLEGSGITLMAIGERGVPSICNICLRCLREVSWDLTGE